ncbi:MAG: hypothetical protein ACD_15C00114G0013 [uncultured bacterium]|nr:MAG: hypothetical protein ACD_15C00114G0013 [uncultured bacterium]
MKTKKAVLAAAFLGAIFLPAASQAVTVCFNPTTQGYDMNGESKLSLWGVTAMPNGLTADAKNSWQTELSVASWYANLLKAQDKGKQVGVAYDPVTGDIWYIGHMITCTANTNL